MKPDFELSTTTASKIVARRRDRLSGFGMMVSVGLSAFKDRSQPMCALLLDTDIMKLAGDLLCVWVSGQSNTLASKQLIQGGVALIKLG